MKPSDIETLMERMAEKQNQVQALEAEMNERITQLKGEYKDLLEPHKEEFKSLMFQLKEYALHFKEKLFQEKRSLKTMFGTFGFRLGNPSVKQQKGVPVEETLKRLRERAPQWMITKESINKEAILGDRENEEARKALAGCGLEIKQSESFYVELQLEEVPLEQ